MTPFFARNAILSEMLLWS